MINVFSKVWDRTSNKWVADEYAILGNGRIMINVNGKEWERFKAGERYLISNYSGIDDSSGKKVFDGHIVRFNYGKPVRIVTAPVVFVNGGFFALTPNENPKMCFLSDLKESSVRFDIVGDVFENAKCLGNWNK